MYALEQHAGDRAGQLADILAHDHNILGADDHVHRHVFAKARVHAREIHAAEGHQLIVHHRAADDVAFADKARHEGVLGLVVDGLGRADLQDAAAVHHHDGIAHGQRFLLIVGNINEGNAQLLLHGFELQLHFLAQLQIQRAQRLVQQQHVRLVDQRAGNGDALLLTARKRIHAALAIAGQVDQAQHLIHTAVDFAAAHLFDLEAKGDVIPHVQVRKQRVLLEHRIDAALIGRHIGDVLALVNYPAGGGILKAADQAQGGGLSAA